MSKSIKLQDDTYWDSNGIVNGKTPLPDYLFWIDKLTRSVKTIWTQNENGVRIEVTKYVNDKMPIIILGADNASYTSVISVIRGYQSTSEQYASWKDFGFARNVTRNGNIYHIEASLFSTYWVLVPMGAEITVTNASL